MAIETRGITPRRLALLALSQPLAPFDGDGNFWAMGALSHGPKEQKSQPLAPFDGDGNPTL